MHDMREIVKEGKVVYDNIKAVRGEDYARLVALWAKIRLLRLGVQRMLSPWQQAAFDDTTCALFATIQTEMEQRLGKKFDTSRLDEDAIGFTSAMMGPLGVVMRRKKGDENASE